MNKIDCSITRNFLQEIRRLCDSYSHCEDECILFDCDKEECLCTAIWNIEKVIEIVQKWSDAHPIQITNSD